MLFEGTIGLFQTLKEIGLTAKEANLYLVMHDIGANPASIIAKRCGLNRSGCYSLLNTLVEKGFAQKSMKNKILYFHPTDTKVILQQLNIKKGRLNDTIENIDKLITQFNTLQKDYTVKPSVVFFEGAAGIKNIMEDTLDTDGLIRIYSSLDEITLPQSEYWNEYELRRATKGIRMKAIYPANSHSYLRKKNDAVELRESRLIPPEFNFHLNIIIYDSKVSLASLNEQFGLMIESEEMSRAYKKIFDLVWEGTRKFDLAMTSIMRQRHEKIE